MYNINYKQVRNLEAMKALTDFIVYTELWKDEQEMVAEIEILIESSEWEGDNTTVEFLKAAKIYVEEV